MKRYALLALLFVAVPVAAQPKFPKLGAPPTEPATARLGADTLYVVESETPYLLLDSPQGLVTVLEKPGPISVFGKFADGSGKYELREFKAKNLWIIQANGTGTVELLMVPHGTPKPSDVVRKVLDVSTGGTIPPPAPTPTGKPAHITFIGPEKSAEALATNNDAALRAWLKDRGIKVHVLKSGDAGIKAAGLTDAVASAGGEPCFVVQDTGGRVLESSRLSGVGAVKASIAALSGQPDRPKIIEGEGALRERIDANVAAMTAAEREEWERALQAVERNAREK